MTAKVKKKTTLRS